MGGWVSYISSLEIKPVPNKSRSNSRESVTSMLHLQFFECDRYIYRKNDGLLYYESAKRRKFLFAVIYSNDILDDIQIALKPLEKFGVTELGSATIKDIQTPPPSEVVKSL